MSWDILLADHSTRDSTLVANDAISPIRACSLQRLFCILNNSSYEDVPLSWTLCFSLFCSYLYSYFDRRENCLDAFFFLGFARRVKGFVSEVGERCFLNLNNIPFRRNRCGLFNLWISLQKYCEPAFPGRPPDGDNCGGKKGFWVYSAFCLYVTFLSR